MGELVISARGLGKRYRVGEVESGVSLARRALRRSGRDFIWAIQDLDFDVHEGDALALVGRNGAGKSTLLKVLSRITEPSAGFADLAGRVGALLEIGVGFHPMLTGRENVFLSGAILGMHRGEVRRKFDEIVEFAGVARHIDTPVRWYSSGMYVRLAFAVAAHLEPDILVVDEVLAVGDAEFQKRSLGRMGEIAHEGRTVLFVSHNLQAVRSLCDRALLLEAGRLVADGDTESIVRRYLATVDPPESGRRRWLDPGSRPGTDAIRLAEVRVEDSEGQATATFFSSRPISVVLELDVSVPQPGLIVAVDLLTPDGARVFRSYSSDAGSGFRPALDPGRTAVRCTIPACLLAGGRYLVTVRALVRGIDWVFREEGVLHFDVTPDHGESYFLDHFLGPVHGRPGVVAPILAWDEVEPSASAGGEGQGSAAVGR